MHHASQFSQKTSHFIERNIYVLILCVLFLGLLVRVYDLPTNPPGFFADEAAIGYNAYTLLTTGKDEYGEPWPIFFRSFGDYRLPIPIYANIVTTSLFGLSEISVRLTTILFGIISILFLILAARAATTNGIALLTGFLLAISPWHIQMSRWGSEYIYFPAIFSIALYFLLLSRHKKYLLPISYFFFGIAMYTYYPSLFVTPLFLIVASLYFVYTQKFQNVWKIVVISSIVFIVVCIPIYHGTTSGILLTRWNSVNSKQIQLSEKIQQFAKTYIDHFSLDFLFLKGDIDMPGHFITRHSVRGVGQLYTFQLPLLFLGLVYILLKKRSMFNLLILWLLVLYPLGSAITNDGALATRSVIGIIPLIYISGVGLWYSFQLLERFKLRALNVLYATSIILIVTISSLYYLHLLYMKYPFYSSDFWGWQYGARDIVSYFVSQEQKYDALYMAPEFNAPHIFFKFYAPIACSKCQIGLPKEQYSPNQKQLFAIPPSYLQNNPDFRFATQKTVYYPSGTVAFLIGEVVK